jgi:hypothetical protein
MNIWIVVPAWRRYNVSEVVFEELNWLKKQVSKKIKLEVVVIADDENLNLAIKNKFRTIKSPNNYLGKKFNDGYEYAFKNGADVVLPSGSDSFIHPDIFKGKELINWNKQKIIYYSTIHAMVNENGTRLGIVQIPNKKGMYNKGALWFYPKSLMVSSNFRPCDEKINSSCDKSTIINLIKNNKSINFKSINYNNLQYLALKNNKIQIWKYKLYKDRFIEEFSEPYIQIANYYNKDLSEKVRGLYK